MAVFFLDAHIVVEKIGRMKTGAAMNIGGLLHRGLGGGDEDVRLFVVEFGR